MVDVCERHSCDGDAKREGGGKVDAVSCPLMNAAITLRRLAVSALAATTIGVGPVDHIVDAGRSGPEVPERIDVDSGNKVFLVGHAVGVQIYRCDPAATGFGWALVAPRADLYGDNGKVIVTHYGGPTWEAKDGSTVVATRVDGVTMNETAIPWLKLKTKSAVAGSDGDRLAGTTFIHEGQPNDHLWVVVSGRCEVRGAGAVVATLGAGAAVGEISLVSGAPAVADVVAIEPAVLLRLAKSDFDVVAKRHPELLARVEKLVVQREKANRALFQDASDLIV